MTTPEPRRARIATRLRVRYAETDAAGGVYHGQYLTYFEVARVEALRGLGVPVGEFAARGILMPVVEARVKYLRPAHLDDLLEVSILLDRVGPATFAFDYEIARDGLLLAKGWTRSAVVDRETGKAICLPAWVRELLEGLAQRST
jgi:acyl-CoA thioester hydrolase